MRPFSTQASSAAVVAAAATALLISSAAAHPHSTRKSSRCSLEDTRQIAAAVSCGETSIVSACFDTLGLTAQTLQACLVEAGCTSAQAEDEAAWAAERCQEDDDEGASVTAVVVELREVRDVKKEIQARDTTTTTSDEATTTSDATTSTTSDATTSSTTSTSTTDSTSSSASTTSSSDSTSSTATATTSSSTSSGTASSTSSTASSTSTSTSDSDDSVPTIGWVIAVVMAVYVAACIGGIGYCCIAERKTLAAKKLAAEKQALMRSRP